MNMKELRFAAADGVWRVAFAFDPKRKAILPIAGNKAGVSESRFYRRLIAVAINVMTTTSPRSPIKENDMPVSLADKMKQLPPARRKKVEARAAELIAEEMTLRELRQARKLTQVIVAKKLGVSQDSISRLESRTDLLLSTLRKTIEAMGGRLSLVAEFPDRSPIVVTSIADPPAKPLPPSRRRVA